jgi:hypothetical protein
MIKKKKMYINWTESDFGSREISTVADCNLNRFKLSIDNINGHSDWFIVSIY